MAIWKFVRFTSLQEQVSPGREPRLGLFTLGVSAFPLPPAGAPRSIPLSAHNGNKKGVTPRITLEIDVLKGLEEYQRVFKNFDKVSLLTFSIHL